MDDFTISGEIIDQTLLEIEHINRWLGGNKVTLSGIRKLLDSKPPVPSELTIADLGTGGGEMLEKIDQLGKKASMDLKLTGIDANPYIIRFCQNRYHDKSNFSFIACNVLSDEFANQKYDIITATLFMHHFSDEQLILLLRQIVKQAKYGVVINDLQRHWFAYYSIKLLTALFSRSSMVRYDAPLSVKRAFTKNELRRFLNKAGISNYAIKWKWAFRWQVIIRCH